MKTQPPKSFKTRKKNNLKEKLKIKRNISTTRGNDPPPYPLLL